MRLLIARLRRDESGSAILEFVFLGVVVLVPLIYAIASVATVQRSTLAVRDAAREAGRAYATTPTSPSGEATNAAAGGRVLAAVRMALANQGLPDDASVRIVAPAAGCDGPAVTPSFMAGAEFAVCVRRTLDLPGVPTVLAGRGITTVGRYVVHVDDFRAAS